MDFIEPQPEWTDDQIPICSSSCRYFDSGKKSCSITENMTAGSRCRPGLVALRTQGQRQVDELRSNQDFLTGKFAALDAAVERDYDLGVKRDKANILAHKVINDKIDVLKHEVLEKLDETKTDIAERFDLTGKIIEGVGKDVRALGDRMTRAARDSQSGFASRDDVDRVLAQRLTDLEEIAKRTESAAASSRVSAETSATTAITVGEHANAIAKMVPSNKRRAAGTAGGLFVVIYMIIEVIEKVLKATGK